VKKIEILGARLVDPASRRDETASLFIAGPTIVGTGSAPAGWRHFARLSARHRSAAG
jgi:hypothetical protein